jgi:hypothetical protein
VDHGDEHGAKACQKSATAETGGGAEATGRNIGGKLARPCAAGWQAPIQHCFLTESLFEIGMGTLVLARGVTRRHLALSSFLIDVFCLGIKDVMFESVESEVFEMYMEASDAGSPMVSVDPSYARKLLRDLAAWSQSIGFAPHRDFTAVEPIFGDVSADASETVFRFGRDGRPVYIPGPNDDIPLIRRRIKQLQKYLGDDGFGFETAA